MINPNAEEMLKQYHATAYSRQIHTINHRIRCAVGYGHSNCTIIEGDTSLILIDALESDQRAMVLKNLLHETTDKPVKTIIYTHGHPDHQGGSGAFRDTVEEVIAFAPKRPALKYMDKLSDVLGQRTAKQFGYTLDDDELITQGLGIREGFSAGDGKYDILPPTTLYHEDHIVRTIDGITLEMTAAVGETDDQIFVWLPADQIMCCGDNYYGCWPNLYAIRGSQYRDIAAWVDSLETILTYPSVALLPGHTNPIIGTQQIQEVLNNYKNAIQSVLLQTLDCMNNGFSESQTVQAVALSEEYRSLPYLQEFYGTISWSVRSIYHGYFGWFDGNPTNLNPLPDDVFALKLCTLIGTETLLAEAHEANENNQHQLCLQLCDLLLLAKAETNKAHQLKKEALLALSHLITSANGRHYYLTEGKEV